MTIQILEDLSEVPVAQWDALNTKQYPFLNHAFLQGMEQHGCVGEAMGWIPQHILIKDDAGVLLAALPLYLKDNSYGELVFDWAWADAYHRLGLPYYPKLVNAIPYTPATGPRLLHQPTVPQLADQLAAAAVAHAQTLEVSSLHVLFPRRQDEPSLSRNGLLQRTAYQYQWINRNYANFDDFLAGLSHKKRKQIRRERRQIADAHIKIQVLHGHELSEEQWHWLNQFYQITFLRKGGLATFNEAFFRHVGEQLQDQMLVFYATLQGEALAASICFRSQDTLYGRHWGCREDFSQLHFELCYYQGIDYCIENKLSRFEPGAQGDYKLARGFLPTETRSYHWLENANMRQIIHRYLLQETDMVRENMDERWQHQPYKDSREELSKFLDRGFYR